jgi:hypothetical protein
VPEAGWASKENGELLALAADKYDVFVTVDRNLTTAVPISQLSGPDHVDFLGTWTTSCCR